MSISKHIEWEIEGGEEWVILGLKLHVYKQMNFGDIL